MSGGTTAVMEPGLAVLARSVPLQALEAEGHVLAGIRIIDVSGALVRAPTVTFRSTEIALSASGSTSPMTGSWRCWRAAAAESGLPRLPVSVSEASMGGDQALLTLSNGETVEASLVIAADGRDSLIRDAAGIRRGAGAIRRRR